MVNFRRILSMRPQAFEIRCQTLTNFCGKHSQKHQKVALWIDQFTWRALATMSDNSPNLQLPYIAAAQAQKHVTHNEAIRKLDALVHLSVLDRDLATAPIEPQNGECYIVATGATGQWAGRANQVAAFQDGGWTYFVPREGWIAWVNDEDLLVAWDGNVWVAAGAMPSLNPVAVVGINATADAAHRLSVSAPATLMNHAGGGHQLKLNKASSSHTASVLFQTDSSGRAEVGLTGDDNLHAKVSPDGSTWSEAVVVDRTSGNVGIGATPSVKCHVKVAAGSVASRVETLATDTSSTYAAFEMRHGSGVNATFTTGYGYFYFGTTSNHRSAWIANNAERVTLEATGNMRPSTDNAQSLGQSGNRWSSIWAATGTIQTSDSRDKSRVGGLEPFAELLVDQVSPHLYRWTIGGNDIEIVPATEAGKLATLKSRPRSGKRVHAGFFAQDIRAAMDVAGIDFGAWGLEDKDDPASRQWVRPDELVPVLWQALKDTRCRLAALEREYPLRGDERSLKNQPVSYL